MMRRGVSLLSKFSLEISIKSKGIVLVSVLKTMAEEQKAEKQASANQLTLDNFDEAEETDEQYGHLTAHLVET